MNRNVKISKSMAKREVTLVSKCFVVELATLDMDRYRSKFSPFHR